jgi:hypothetical protein
MVTSGLDAYAFIERWIFSSKNEANLFDWR